MEIRQYTFLNKINQARSKQNEIPPGKSSRELNWHTIGGSGRKCLRDYRRRLEIQQVKLLPAC